MGKYFLLCKPINSDCLMLLQVVEAARSGQAARLEVADAAAGAAADDKDIEQQLVVQAADQGASRRNVLLEMLEALLQQYPQQQQGLDNEGPGTDRPSSTGEVGLLPKEIFIRQLIKIACVEGSEKVVIFSESLTVLDALEDLLQQEFCYRLHRQYVRLEGKTGAEERRRLIRTFNKKPQMKVSRSWCSAVPVVWSMVAIVPVKGQIAG